MRSVTNKQPSSKTMTVGNAKGKTQAPKTTVKRIYQPGTTKPAGNGNSEI